MKNVPYFSPVMDTCLEFHDMPDSVCLVHGTIMQIQKGEKYCVLCHIVEKKQQDLEFSKLNISKRNGPSPQIPSQPSVYQRTV